jgi:ATP-dependent Lhr-like helicase
MDALASFHPAVRRWFERRFPAGPSVPQLLGWPPIARGRDTLIAAPTGSGKTLAAFLVCIDRLYREFACGAALPEGTDVVYVSPLKALAADIHKNLEIPVREIAEVARELALAAPEIRVLVRTGDTPAAARAAMVRRPPHVLVTTPESLYLVATAERSRAALRGVRTLIVDEIHAVARDKRGSHLALTLERVAALCERPPARIGLSATQRPIEDLARLLVGVEPGPHGPPRARPCEIVDAGHRRDLDLGIEVPGSELGAVCSMEQWGEILDRIAEHAAAHRTTLVFSNTRRLAERVAHLLQERLGEEQVAAHHGSLSRERRQRAEERLRSGELRVMVATASLELGIDIGPLDLVCQLGSPRSIATFLQRVGRSGHARGATPKGRLFPTTRDELVECAALLRAVRRGELDLIHPPTAPLDILSQQIVAACASQPWTEDELFALVRRASPFAELSRAEFDELVEMLSEGIETGRGRRSAYLHRDRIHGRLRGRRGARLAALTSGGAIPETADYRVLADPDDTFVGTVNEDWAIESMAGDIFLLGSTSWLIRRVEAGVVRVVDARGAAPTIPFWLGEAPSRTVELSAAVAELRADVQVQLERGGSTGALAQLAGELAIDTGPAEQLIRYLDAARSALGRLPTQQELVVERFFDEAGGQQLVVHAPLGGRVNRALGLLARKRICRKLDFELQAAASDDAVVLSLGPQHSFPLQDFPRLLGRAGAKEALTSAVLLSPMFTARWRWNLGRALLVLRQRGGRRNPPPLQRMEADDLMAAIFPGLAQCQENQAGPIDVPDHPLVRQTLRDCLHEALDLDGLLALLARLESGEVRLLLRENTEPSPLAHEILNSRPYTFLDDAPLEERRTRAVQLRRGLPVEARDLARLDADAVARVCQEARLEPRDPDELHDALLGLVIARPVREWQDLFAALEREGRAATLETEAGPLWLAAERLPHALALFPRARLVPALRLPEPLAALRVRPEEAAAVALRGHLDSCGPATPHELARATLLPPALIEQAAAALESEGFALRGRFRPERAAPDAGQELCARRLLARIHAYTQDRLRREIEPVTAQDLLRFLLRWQRVAPGTQREGRRGVLAAVEQLQGFELAAGAWEEAVLPARVTSYRREWLDELCFAGEITWGRLSVRGSGAAEAEPAVEPGRGGLVPSRATPISLARRADLPWLLAAARGALRPTLPGEGAPRELLELLRQRGALFQTELTAGTRRLPIEVEEGLWDLVARGWVSADGFQSVRALLGSRERRGRSRVRAAPQGRWALMPEPSGLERDRLAEAVAGQLLGRWGVLLRDVLVRENLALPWRELLWALRRLEERGLVRGGRFATGFVGEQYALPGAVEALRHTRRLERRGEIVRVSAVDPLNLVGVLTPGARVPAVRTREVVYRDGLPVAAGELGARRG